MKRSNGTPAAVRMSVVTLAPLLGLGWEDTLLVRFQVRAHRDGVARVEFHAESGLRVRALVAVDSDNRIHSSYTLMRARLTGWLHERRVDCVLNSRAIARLQYIRCGGAA